MPELSTTDRGNNPMRRSCAPARQWGGSRATLARELSLARDDDRERLSHALRKRGDNGLLVLDLPKGNTRKFRTLIMEVIDLTSEQGIDGVARMLRRPERSSAEGSAPRRALAARPDERQRAWAKLRSEFLSRFDTAGPRELAELTGSRARNVAARAYEWVKAARIFGVHDGRETRYPLFQIKEGKPIPQVAAVLRALRSRGFSDWEMAMWFATPNANIGDWELPADALAQDPDAVTRAAASAADEVVY